MIDPIQIIIKFDNMELFKKIKNVSFSEDADIEIKKADNQWLVDANGQKEIWVESLEDEIVLRRAGEKGTIFILTKDKELLPYCMKDRLAYLQDKINKEKI